MRKRRKAERGMSWEKGKCDETLTDIYEAARCPLAELPRLVGKADLNYAWK